MQTRLFGVFNFLQAKCNQWLRCSALERTLKSSHPSCYWSAKPQHSGLDLANAQFMHSGINPSMSNIPLDRHVSESAETSFFLNLSKQEKQIQKKRKLWLIFKDDNIKHNHYKKWLASVSSICLTSCLGIMVHLKEKLDLGDFKRYSFKYVVLEMVFLGVLCNDRMKISLPLDMFPGMEQLVIL